MHNVASITKSKIIIAALDWGFGHTTRTLVLIKQLKSQGNSIFFAGNQQQTEFIQSEIKGVKTAYLDGYNLTLDSTKNTYWQVGKQLLSINKSIKSEQKWLKETLKKEAFDYIISDNRYGFYHTAVTSILLTHQISLQIPFAKNSVNSILKRYINQFSACWIPDYHNQNLSGKLSNGKLKIPKHFIGPLSRFKITEQTNYKFNYLFIISGPQPECHHFLQRILSVISKKDLNACIAVPFKTKELTAYNALIAPNTETLENAINSARTVVAKAGYTTIMDLIPTAKTAFFLPTAGQYEQVYLSELHKKSELDPVLQEQL